MTVDELIRRLSHLAACGNVAYGGYYTVQSDLHNEIMSALGRLQNHEQPLSRIVAFPPDRF